MVQLQGHLFFGNATLLSDSIKDALEEKSGTEEEPLIVILDFTLINGMDSSAALAMKKLKDAMHRQFNIELAIFVTGCREGFPCEYNLSEELSDYPVVNGASLPVDMEENGRITDEKTIGIGEPLRFSTKIKENETSLWRTSFSKSFPSNYVCESLDSALIFAENVLIALEDPTVLDQDTYTCTPRDSCQSVLDLNRERELALQYLQNLCPGALSDDLLALLSLFEREEYKQDQIIWRQGSTSDCAKLVVKGDLVAILESEASGTEEHLGSGAMFGELGLVNMTDRLSTVKCVSEEVVLYSITREKWDELQKENPTLARFIDLIVIRYLAHRVQHVSNRIFETRCLPV